MRIVTRFLKIIQKKKTTFREEINQSIKQICFIGSEVLNIQRHNFRLYGRAKLHSILIFILGKIFVTLELFQMLISKEA